jgi:hypothetical protein
MIDVTTINFGYFGLLLLLVFLSCLIGAFAGPYRRILGAIVATIVFGIGFVAWNYYPHGLRFLPTSPTRTVSAPAPQPAAAAPAAPTGPAKPAANPFRDITPRQ